MKSKHPGGWEDIANFMEKEEIFVPDSRGRTLSPTEILEKYDDGESSAMLCRALMAHGWYVPGDLYWTKPCSEWSHKFHLTRGG